MEKLILKLKESLWKKREIRSVWVVILILISFNAVPVIYRLKETIKHQEDKIILLQEEISKEKVKRLTEYVNLQGEYVNTLEDYSTEHVKSRKTLEDYLKEYAILQEKYVKLQEEYVNTLEENKKIYTILEHLTSSQ